MFMSVRSIELTYSLKRHVRLYHAGKKLAPGSTFADVEKAAQQNDDLIGE